MRKGFTLIELLIVIAIIAILALIAIPNFIEAQVRSKVARTKADMKTVETSLKAYFVDNNAFPILWPDQLSRRWAYSDYLRYLDPGSNLKVRACPMLTTPIAYMTSYPLDPFMENAANSAMQVLSASYLFFNLQGAYNAKVLGISAEIDTFIDAPTKDIYFNGASASNKGKRYTTSWALFSPGPCRNLLLKPLHTGGNVFVDNRLSDSGFLALRTGRMPTYDPTNGTVSDGPIVRLEGGVE